MLNFAQVWLSVVIGLFTSQDQAPWLEGISELNVEVVEVGSGSASESNLIHIPISDFDPEVLINNTTYPIALQAYNDAETVIQLDKYQTKVTTLSDDQIIGAAYDRIMGATKPHVTSITKAKYRKAIHALGAASNAANTPVLEVSGDVVPGAQTRKRMVYNDLVKMKDQADTLEWPEEGRRVVLSTEHFNDLLLTSGEIGKALINYQAGKTSVIIAGWEIYSYVANPLYTSAGVKRPFGAVANATDRKGSVFFSVGNVVKKTGMTKQYFADSKTDPENQTNRLNYRHYFIVLPVRNRYVAAMY